MNDRELLELIKSDSEKGVSILIDTYGALVYKIVSSVVLSVGSPSDAEECVNDVFVAFYNNAHKVDLSKSSIKGFLAMIAKRNAIDTYRFLKRRENINKPLEDGADFKSQDFQVDYETRHALFSAIKNLGHPDSEIFTRRYVLGEKTDEIALAVGLSGEAVQKRIERGKTKLRGILGGCF